MPRLLVYFGLVVVPARRHARGSPPVLYALKRT
jgi:hypothetical protein